MAGWTDRNEYDLVLKIRVEASPQKQLELLNQWKQKYPHSEMRQVRRELFLAAYQASGDVVHMFETAREMLGEQSNNFVGVYWSALLIPEIKDSKPETLDVGEKAARQLQAGLDTYFAPSQKPEGVADADWQKQKSAAGLLALRAIGWVAWQRGDFAAAENSFTAYLNQEPKSARSWPPGWATCWHIKTRRFRPPGNSRGLPPCTTRAPCRKSGAARWTNWWIAYTPPTTAIAMGSIN